MHLKINNIHKLFFITFYKKKVQVPTYYNWLCNKTKALTHCSAIIAATGAWFPDSCTVLKLKWNYYK